MYSFSKKTLKSSFIIASPRSGTTWLSKMLNAHQDVFCVERRLFGNYADFVEDIGAKSPRLRVTLDKYVNSLFLHHGLDAKNKNTLTKSLLKTLEAQEKRLSGKSFLIDKITPYLNTSAEVLSQINTYYPKSKLVFLVRDGRDVLTSGVFHWFNKQPKDTVLTDFEEQRRAIFKDNSEATLPRFFQDKEIQQWANEWVQPLRIIKQAKQTHEVKIIFYEDMLTNPNKVLQEIFDFLSIKNNKTTIKACIEAGSFKKMSDGRVQGDAVQGAHVRKGVSGDWKNYFTYKDALLFDEIAGDALLEFGYETNKNWIEKFR